MRAYQGFGLSWNRGHGSQDAPGMRDGEAPDIPRQRCVQRDNGLDTELWVDEGRLDGQTAARALTDAENLAEVWLGIPRVRL